MRMLDVGETIIKRATHAGGDIPAQRKRQCNHPDQPVTAQIGQGRRIASVDVSPCAVIHWPRW